MINYFNFKKIGNDFLITNDLGMYFFLKNEEFRKLVNNEITKADNCYKELSDKFFVSDKIPEMFINEAHNFLLSLKSYVTESTSLHIFAVTNDCNMNCVYCQAKDIKSKSNGYMTVETGNKAIELAMQSPSKYMTFEFQGGEPLLNFDVIKEMIAHSKRLNKDKNIVYTIVSNLIALDEDKLNYLINEGVSICTSIDGNENVHNHNRKLKNGIGSYDAVKAGVERVRKAGKPIGAIQTTSRYSLKHPKEIIVTYVSLDIFGVFLRPLTPLGFARAHWDEIGYSTEEYLVFYRAALEYIIEINKNGRHFPEIHAGYFLKKILGGYSDNYMELRSPCGASIGQLSYYYDGNVYTCDEGRMLSETGDCSFRLGNVHENTYDQLMNSMTCKATCAASVVESLPHCCDCAYQPYCGVCPVVAYAESKDIFPKFPHDYRCKVYKGMLDIIFDKIYKNDEDVMRVFRSWIEVN